MIDLKELYSEKLPRKYRSQVHFKELFYNKYTTNATRAFIIDAAMHFDANRPSEKLYYNKGVRDDVGIGRFQIGWETDANGLPRNFYIKHTSSRTLLSTKIKATPSVQKTLRRSRVDPTTARLARQALHKQVDPAKGLKMQAATLEIMKLILMIQKQLEVTILLHDKGGKFITSPPGSRKHKSPWDVVEAPGADESDPYGEPHEQDEPRIWDVGGLVEHVTHYLQEGEKMKEFIWILNAEQEWASFANRYRIVRQDGEENGNQMVVLRAHPDLDEDLCMDCVKALDSLHQFANKIHSARFNTGICAKRLKKMPASRKIPKVYSHETKGTWKINSEKLMVEDYSKRMKTIERKLDKWRTIQTDVMKNVK